MKILRTPEPRFKNLKDYNFEPHYFDVQHEDEARPCVVTVAFLHSSYDVLHFLGYFGTLQ